MTFFVSEAPYHPVGGFESQVLAGPGKDGREWYYLNSPSGARWQQSGNLWISKDDGVSWTWMPKGPGTDSLGGSGDSCAAVARDGTIYFSDLLYPATISVESSRDGGQTWLRNPQASVTPVDDRQWLAMGPTIGGNRLSRDETLYMIYNQLASVLWIERSEYSSLGLGWRAGNHGRPVTTDTYFRPPIAVDQHDGTVYLPNVGAAGLSVYVSTDGADSFTKKHVMDGAPTDFMNFCLGADVDGAGNLYLAWTDQRNVTLAVSQDKGDSWRFLTVASGNGTRALPSVTAGDEGRAGVVWYETNETGKADDLQNATWDAVAAVTVDALAQNVTFYRSVVSPAVHVGSVRTTGSSGSSDRDLGDFTTCDVDRLGRLLFPFGNDGNDGPNKYHAKMMVARQTGGPFLRAGCGPVAQFKNEVFGRTVLVDGSGSYDMNGLGISEFRWDWGDGTNTTDRSGNTASHTYRNGGRFQITLSVTDPDNMTSSTSAPVSVSGPAERLFEKWLPLPIGAAAVAAAAAVYVWYRRRRRQGEPVTNRFANSTIPWPQGSDR